MAASAITQIDLRWAGNLSGISDLTVHRLQGQEGIHQGLHYTIELSCPNPPPNVQTLVGQAVEISLWTSKMPSAGDHQPSRRICGLVTKARCSQFVHDRCLIELEIEDVLAILAQHQLYRVFTEQSVRSITQQIIDEHLARNTILAQHVQLDIRVTADEPAAFYFQNTDDRHFLTALWAEQGWNWHIEPGGDGLCQHRLVIWQSKDQLSNAEQTSLMMVQRRALDEDDQHLLLDWSGERRLTVGLLQQQSFDYRETANWDNHKSLTSSSHDPLGFQPNALEASLIHQRVDPPRAARQAGIYRAQLGHKADQCRQTSFGFHGTSTSRALCPASEFVITQADGQQLPEASMRCIAIEVDAVNHECNQLLHGNQTPSPSPETTSAQPAYLVRFQAQTAETVIVPPSVAPRPDPGLLTAIVVGDPKKAVDVDEWGRIPVRFHFMHQAISTNQPTSKQSAQHRATQTARLRVMQPQAGQDRGHGWWPRPGEEVVVQFLHGHPDRPIVIGALYNSRMPPPAWSQQGRLPTESAISGMQSRELGGTGYNELLLDDTREQVGLRLHSSTAQSQLHLGELVTPRQQGQSKPRGQGVDLQTQAALALRGRQGVLISAEASSATSPQLHREALKTQLNWAKSMLQTVKQHLSRTAAPSAGRQDNSEAKGLERLSKRIAGWHDDQQHPTAEGQGMVNVSAPEGYCVSTAQDAAMIAEGEMHTVTGQDLYQTVGGSLLSRALAEIKLLARRGFQLITASGNMQIHAEQHDLELLAGKTLSATALKELVIRAPTIRLVAQGASITLGQGNVLIESEQTIRQRAAAFPRQGPSSPPLALPVPPITTLRTDEQMILVDRLGRPVSNQDYCIKDHRDRVRSHGKTMRDGCTTVVTSDELLPLVLVVGEV